MGIVYLKGHVGRGTPLQRVINIRLRGRTVLCNLSAAEDDRS
jgi:hypothetical protein